MARNTSFIKIEGTLEGLTFYKQDGKNLVRSAGGVSKDRIMTDPKYKRTRENMMEFGGSASAGKGFRTAFSGVVKKLGDSRISSRLSKVMHRILDMDSGARGERPVAISDHTVQLKNFEFNVKCAFSSRFYAPFAAPVVNANRDSVTWTIPPFNPDFSVTAPEGATHFRLLLASGLVSNYEYESATKGYSPTDEEYDGKGLISYSGHIPLNSETASDTVLTVDFAIGSALPLEVTNVVAGGIIFYQELGSTFYELASDNALKVLTLA
ncbi:hypothetical protein QRD02_08605 [Aequorivita sp. SDUM287046]|uniref:Phage tail protein n=1 Tax=Aequorivita aurantiaca TaxID=3053356 RepID=A0ABT8DGD4_9FLAO|nr:hypothetical protein [Aequorivita aurantiaca]MDN3724442.1 hypothetical protein [Aequorivita aurantiaca]